MAVRNSNTNDMNPQSDSDLWEELRAGHKEALRHLFLRYYDDLYRYGLAFCSHENMVKDSIQDLFYELWEKHSNLSSADNVKAYLWVSFRRTLLKKIENLDRSTALFECNLQQIGIVESRESKMIKDERIKINKQLLKEAVSTLSDKEHEALYLKYYEGMSYKEIQMIMDINYQTARNYIYRAIKNIREVIKEGSVIGKTIIEASIIFLFFL